MSTAVENEPAPAPGAGFLARRTGLVMPGVLLLAGVVLAIGTATMTVPATASFPGPQVFPSIIAVLCVVLGVLLAIDVVRHPEPSAVAARVSPDAETAATTETADPDTDATTDTTDTGVPAAATATRPQANRRALAEAVGTVVVFIAALQPVGWLPAGAFLFWGIARALGSRRPVFDVFLAVSISSIVQLAFSAGLGLNLPPGILGGLF